MVNPSALKDFVSLRAPFTNGKKKIVDPVPWMYVKIIIPSKNFLKKEID